METILNLWLKHPPEHSAFFCRVILLMFVCDQVSAGFAPVVAAIGKVAVYHIIVGGFHLATIPLAYLLLRAGFDQDAALLCSLVTMLAASFSRGLVTRRLTADFRYSVWLKGVVVRGVLSVLPSVLAAGLVAWLLPRSIGRVFVSAAVVGMAAVFGAVFIGMTRYERSRIAGLMASIPRLIPCWSASR
jgi:hypothetical protein